MLRSPARSELARVGDDPVRRKIEESAAGVAEAMSQQRHVTPIVREVTAPRAGHVHDLSAIRIGNAAVHLGAGRRTKEDAVDHAVGIVCRAKRGAEVAAGGVLAEVHARTDAQADTAEREVLAAYELSDTAPHERHVLLEVVD